MCIRDRLYSGAVPLPLVELGALNGFTDRAEFQVTMKNLLTYESKFCLLYTSTIYRTYGVRSDGKIELYAAERVGNYGR